MSHANKKPDKVLRAVMPVIPAKAGIQNVAFRAVREILPALLKKREDSMRQYPNIRKTPLNPPLSGGKRGYGRTLKNKQTNPFVAVPRVGGKRVMVHHRHPNIKRPEGVFPPPDKGD